MLFISCTIDALEQQNFATLNIPGAFIQADIEKIIHVKLVGELADLLICVDPSYEKVQMYENGTKVIYTELDKLLYGTLQGALLFWEKFSPFLSDNLDFTPNP